MLLSMLKIVGSEKHLFWLQKVNITKVLKGGSVIIPVDPSYHACIAHLR